MPWDLAQVQTLMQDSNYTADNIRDLAAVGFSSDQLTNLSKLGYNASDIESMGSSTMAALNNNIPKTANSIFNPLAAPLSTSFTNAVQAGQNTSQQASQSSAPNIPQTTFNPNPTDNTPKTQNPTNDTVQPGSGGAPQQTSQADINTLLNRNTLLHWSQQAAATGNQQAASNLLGLANNPNYVASANMTNVLQQIDNNLGAKAGTATVVTTGLNATQLNGMDPNKAAMIATIDANIQASANYPNEVQFLQGLKDKVNNGQITNASDVASGVLYARTPDETKKGTSSGLFANMSSSLQGMAQTLILGPIQAQGIKAAGVVSGKTSIKDLMDPTSPTFIGPDGTQKAATLAAAEGISLGSAYALVAAGWDTGAPLSAAVKTELDAAAADGSLTATQAAQIAGGAAATDQVVTDAQQHTADVTGSGTPPAGGGGSVPNVITLPDDTKIPTTGLSPAQIKALQSAGGAVAGGVAVKQLLDYMQQNKPDPTLTTPTWSPTAGAFQNQDIQSAVQADQNIQAGITPSTINPNYKIDPTANNTGGWLNNTIASVTPATFNKIDPNSVTPISNPSVAPVADMVNASAGTPASLDQTQLDKVRTEQQGVIDQTTKQYLGQAPSPAQLQFLEDSDRGVAQTQALLGSVRGYSPAVASRSIMDQSAAIRQQQARDAMIARAAETQQQGGLLGSLISDQGNRELSIAGQNAQLTQQGNQFNAGLDEQTNTTNLQKALQVALANQSVAVQGNTANQQSQLQQALANQSQGDQTSQFNSAQDQQQKIQQAQLNQATNTANQSAELTNAARLQQGQQFTQQNLTDLLAQQQSASVAQQQLEEQSYAARLAAEASKFGAVTSADATKQAGLFGALKGSF